MFDFNRFNNAMSSAVLNADRLPDLLTALGVDLRPCGEHAYRGPCPIHAGRNPNFRLGTDGDTVPIWWRCHSRHCERQFKPTLLGLVHGVLSFQRGKKVTAMDAVRWLKAFTDDLPLTPPPPRPAPPKKVTKTGVWTRDQVRTQLTIPAPEFVARGFSPQVLEQFLVGHSTKLNRSVVPFLDDTGDLCLGFQARSPFPRCEACEDHHWEFEPCDQGEPKWRVSLGFPKASYLYNFASAVQSASPAVLLVEGPGDVWRAVEAGVPAVAILGNEATVKQAKMLAVLKKVVVIAFDNDEAGQDGAPRSRDRLQTVGVTTHVVAVPPAYHDLGDMPASEVRAWWDAAMATKPSTSPCAA